MRELTESYFKRWWDSCVHREDQDEFVHGPWRGTLDHARFVCALDYLAHTVDKPTDLVLLAYTAAMGISVYSHQDMGLRAASQGMYDEESVRFLLDRLQYRRMHVYEDTIAQIAANKIIELNHRTAIAQGGERDGSTNMAFEEYKDQLLTEKVLLDSANKFLADRQKRRASDLARRGAAVLRRAIASGEKELKNVTAPPTKEEIRQFVAMAREMLSAEEFADVLKTPELPEHL